MSGKSGNRQPCLTAREWLSGRNGSNLSCGHHELRRRGAPAVRCRDPFPRLSSDGLWDTGKVPREINLAAQSEAVEKVRRSFTHDLIGDVGVSDAGIPGLGR